jgi:hypothetical protein
LRDTGQVRSENLGEHQDLQLDDITESLRHAALVVQERELRLPARGFCLKDSTR